MLLILAAGSLVTLLAFVGTALTIYFRAPVRKLSDTWQYSPPWESFKRVAGLKQRNLVEAHSLRPILWLVILNAEDIAFFRHRGFDFHEIYLAITDTLFRGKKLRGASTISQQLVKNFFLTPERRWKRKLIEAIYTVKLERSFSKTQILTLYINNVEFGKTIYGLHDASWAYFDKSPQELNLVEMAILVSLLPSPRARSKAFFENGAFPPTVLNLAERLVARVLVSISHPEVAAVAQCRSGVEGFAALSKLSWDAYLWWSENAVADFEKNKNESKLLAAELIQEFLSNQKGTRLDREEESFLFLSFPKIGQDERLPV